MKSRPFLVSDEEIRQHVPDIMEKSIVLDDDFNILMVSTDLLSLLQYRPEEVCNRNVNILSSQGNLMSALIPKLESGYFGQLPIVLTGKQNSSFRFLVGGFYVGLVAPRGSGIVLKFSEPIQSN